jgi:[ribosomal protein S18]-alanine N-acetyltransferase
MIRAHAGHAEILAALHAIAFPPAEVWQAPAFAAQLAMPGVFGLISTGSDVGLSRLPSPPYPLPQGEGETTCGIDASFPVAGGDALGFALARVAADQAEILTLAVVPAARRRGVGAALLQAVMQAAAARGAAALFLEVSTANDAARALYARAGFCEVGRRCRYYADGTDARVLTRALTAGATATG